MTTTEHAATIRAELKNLGWSSRLVSVRADNYSMGSSIDITIKTPNVPLEVVKKIARGHESIRYCEYSGEILGGGNRYVHVRYDWAVVTSFREGFRARVQAAADQLATRSASTLIPIEGCDYNLGLQFGPGHAVYSLWGDHHHLMFGSVDQLAEAIGFRIASAGQTK